MVRRVLVGDVVGAFVERERERELSRSCNFVSRCSQAATTNDAATSEGSAAGSLGSEVLLALRRVWLCGNLLMLLCLRTSRWACACLVCG